MPTRLRYCSLALALLLVSVVIGCVRILPVGEPPRISKEKLRELLGRPEVTIVDVRHELLWNDSSGKIPGAVRGDAKSTNWAQAYPKDAFLVLYCSCGSDQTSVVQAQKLLDRRYTNVWVLTGGWLEWSDAGYPVEQK